MIWPSQSSYFSMATLCHWLALRSWVDGKYMSEITFPKRSERVKKQPTSGRFTHLHQILCSLLLHLILQQPILFKRKMQRFRSRNILISWYYLLCDKYFTTVKCIFKVSNYTHSIWVLGSRRRRIRKHECRAIHQAFVDWHSVMSPHIFFAFASDRFT